MLRTLIPHEQGSKSQPVDLLIYEDFSCDQVGLDPTCVTTTSSLTSNSQYLESCVQPHAEGFWAFSSRSPRIRERWLQSHVPRWSCAAVGTSTAPARSAQPRWTDV